MCQNGSKTWDVFKGKAEDKLEMLVTVLGLLTELESCLPSRKMLKTSGGHILLQRGWKEAVDYYR